MPGEEGVSNILGIAKVEIANAPSLFLERGEVAFPYGDFVAEEEKALYKFYM